MWEVTSRKVFYPLTFSLTEGLLMMGIAAASFKLLGNSLFAGMIELMGEGRVDFLETTTNNLK
jgi:hypothetical protein